MNPLGGIPVLMFHDIADRPVNRALARLTVPPALFGEQLDALKESGYATVTAGCLRDLEEVPSRTVVLTFDDGLTSFADLAAPQLESRSMAATVFVPTAFVGASASWLGAAADRLRLMTWDTLRDMSAAGIEVGSHGHRHAELDVLPNAMLYEELRTSARIIEHELQQRCRAVAYPFGYQDRRVRRAAAACRYEVGCSVEYAMYDGQDRLRVRRLLVSPATTPDRLRAMLEAPQRTPEQRARVALASPWRALRRSRHAVARKAQRWAR